MGVGGTLWLKDLCYKCDHLSHFYCGGEGDAILLVSVVGIAPFLPPLCRELLVCQQSDNRSLQPVKQHAEHPVLLGATFK